MKKMQLLAIALFAAILGIAVFMPLSAAASKSANSPAAGTSASTFTGIPVTGHFPGGGTFAGTLNVTQFAAQNGNLVAIGNLSGTLTNRAGQVVGTVTNQAVTLPVTPQQATCSILNLMLGPLDLNLLGLMVHLDKVVLNITAQSGPGNLLGNLLCDIANLLNNGGLLSTLVADLNQILSLLP